MSGKVPVTAPIDTAGTNDTYPTHYSNKGYGGYYCVDSDAERNLISTDRRDVGMAVYVNEITSSQPYGKLSILVNDITDNNWVNIPLRKIQFISSPISTDFDNANILDMIISNDYTYICVDKVNNIGVWKKILMSLV